MTCLLNIWGVMLFLRLTWVIGQAGESSRKHIKSQKTFSGLFFLYLGWSILGVLPTMLYLKSRYYITNNNTGASKKSLEGVSLDIVNFILE